MNPNQEWFARVNGVAIPRSTLVSVLRADQIDAGLTRDEFDPAIKIFETAARLTDDEILRQVAHVVGVTVLPQEIHAELVEQLAPNIDVDVWSELDRERYAEIERQYLDLRRLTSKELEQRAEGQILRRKIAVSLKDASFHDWLSMTRSAQNIELQLDSETLEWVMTQLAQIRGLTPVTQR